MIIIPAIDLLDEKVVRLKKGIMEDATEYGHDPRDVALMFAELGVERLHIVDLNGARTGENQNFNIIKEVVKKSNLQIEVGGGIRDMARLDTYMDMGISYAILGTVAVKDPEFVKAAAKKYPNKIILGIDAKNMMAATEGWYEESSLSVFDIIKRYEGCQIDSIIFTDIEKDGMLSGINVKQIKKVADNSIFPVIASGGVSGIDDIKLLRSMDHKNIKGCIVGKAIYENIINLEEVFS